MRRIKIIAVVITTVTLIWSNPLQANNLLQEVHDDTATVYLGLLDQGKFLEGWQAMSPLFRSIHDQQRWTQRVSAIRESYGGIISRDTRRCSYRNTYKNSPDGAHVIIQFNSVFENKSQGVETLVLRCQTDNRCTIVDYIIN